MRHSGQHLPGLIVGVGIGLLVGAALVEQQMLTLSHKAWASGLGIAMVVVGNLVSRHVKGREAAQVASRD